MTDERERKTKKKWNSFFPLLLQLQSTLSTDTLQLLKERWQLLTLNVWIYWNECTLDNSTLCICIAHFMPILLHFFLFYFILSIFSHFLCISANNYTKMNEVIFILKGVKLQNNELNSFYFLKNKSNSKKKSKKNGISWRQKTHIISYDIILIRARESVKLWQIGLWNNFKWPIHFALWLFWQVIFIQTFDILFEKIWNVSLCWLTLDQELKWKHKVIAKERRYIWNKDIQQIKSTS